jgi:cytochrome oxidase Cu insertion factor (SCO1/SenC/PrrC family)
MSGKRSRRARQTSQAQEQRSSSRRSGNSRRLVAVAIIVLAIAAAAVIAVVAFGQRGKVETSAPPGAAKARTAEKGPFRTVLASGAALTSRDLSGRPTVAAFVIEDCTSCVNTLHTLTALSKDGVRTIAVNVNVPPGTNPVTAAQRLASFGSDVSASGQILYAADPGQRTATAFGVRQIESYLLFDRHGREVGHGIALSPKQIRRALKLT